MAIQHAAVSIQVEDDDGTTRAFDTPFNWDDAVATISNLVAWAQGLGAAVDLITEGKITKIRISLLIPLPSGIKTAPVAHSNLEETGLFTLAASGTPHAYGDDVPAFSQSKFVGGNINLSDSAVAAYLTYISTIVNGIQGSDRYGNALTGAALKARKTFRKHRRTN